MTLNEMDPRIRGDDRHLSFMGLMRILSFQRRRESISSQSLPWRTNAEHEMSNIKRWMVKGTLIASALCGLSAAQALTMDEARGMAVGESDARVEAIAKAVAQGSEKTAAYLQALADDVVKMAGERVIVVRDGQGLDPVTGQAVSVPPDAEDVMLNNRLRGEIDTALAALKLFSPDVKLRRQAALSLLKEPDASRAPLLDKALAAEKDPRV
jgi:urea transport system permease protein